MSTAVRRFVDLINLGCGQLAAAEQATPARRVQLAVAALLAALLPAAMWGLAAGSAAPALAVADAFKVPLLVLVTAACALPVGLLTLKLGGARLRADQMLLAYAGAVLCGALVLAVLAPVLAIYYQTSSWAGTSVAIGSVGAGLAVAITIFVRNLIRLAPAGAPRLPVGLAAAAVMIVFAVALLQLVALASPILPADTVFDGGIDRLLPGGR
jgi:hypothetical protein